ncbi:hypothetical protein D3C81_1105670 [compost metagenome]
MKVMIMTAAALLMTGTASAASVNWEGIYLGAQATHGEGHSEDLSNADASKESIRGFSDGLQAGRIWQFDNNVVAGIEGGLTIGGIDREWKDRVNNQYSPYYGKDAVTHSGMVNAKLGYAAGKWLSYITAAVTAARQEFTLGCDKFLVEETNGCRVAVLPSSRTARRTSPLAPTSVPGCCIASASASPVAWSIAIPT